MSIFTSILTGLVIGTSAAPQALPPMASLPLSFPEPLTLTSEIDIQKPQYTANSYVPRMAHIPFGEWQAEPGDRFIADTANNIGYIIHADGTYTSQRIGSGKQTRVSYMGKNYVATTPEKQWTVRSTSIQGDKGIFGKSGLFLRLFDGDTETSYGIHATGNINDILSKESRYFSMGCVLVSDELLQILLETYQLNGNSLSVETSRRVKNPDPSNGIQ